MSNLDKPALAVIMGDTVRHRVAFRREHAAELRPLFDAEDAYRQGGERAAMAKAIANACSQRPDLAGEIQRLFFV